MTISRSEPADGGVIRIVAAVVVDGDGRTLLVRMRGTRAFMQPGGKPGDGETSLDALSREIREELGCAIDPHSCRSLGRFRAPAANEPGQTVEADLFAATLSGAIRPAAEIAEAIWIDPATEDGLVLAPLIRNHALPLARAMRKTHDTIPL